jgi:predicted metalloprotease
MCSETTGDDMFCFDKIREAIADEDIQEEVDSLERAYRELQAKCFAGIVLLQRTLKLQSDIESFLKK